MRRLRKNERSLVTMLTICMIAVALIVLAVRSKDLDFESILMNHYQENQDKLVTDHDVYVLSISTDKIAKMDDAAAQRENERILQEMSQMLKNKFYCCQGVYILGIDSMSDSFTARQYHQLFRESGNVFWRYNPRNVSYYHPEDNCGLLKYLDNDSNQLSDQFEILGEDEYSRNYLPYYYMKMEGYDISYDKKNFRYALSKDNKNVRYLYADEDGTVIRRKTSRANVYYFDYEEFYQMIQDSKDDSLKDAVIMIQDDKMNSSYSNRGKNTETLADYYIDVMATLDQEATMPNLGIGVKLCLILVGIFLLGMAVIFLRTWLSLLIYVLDMAALFLIHYYCYFDGICYIPVMEYMVLVTTAILLLFVAKRVLIFRSARTLPIDAVIRFTGNIMHIENSVSYSEYLMKNREEIEVAISASLLLPMMDRNSFMLNELAAENHRNKRFVETHFKDENNQTENAVLQVRTNLFADVRYVAFVPLPVFDRESEEVTYTVIGIKKKLKGQNASYISMMLFSMYIYFKAQHERGEHQRMYFSMLSLMISVIDAKDPVTAGHSQRVANISRDIGIWLKLNKSEQFDLEFTALLHDIGKIGVSDYVLNKPSVYTQDDFEQMKHHTIRGAEMLSEVGISEDIIDGVRHHHERIDGKGYPDGLRGDELHLFAKIIKIADVFDALTSKRQYKDAWEIDKALNIIYRGRGTEFDEKIADVFIQHMSPPGWIPPVEDNVAKDSRDPYLEKAVEIAKNFSEKYDSFIATEYPLQSNMATEIDFSCEHGFMNYDWGETFNNARFLEEKPIILAYEKGTQSLVFGQCCNVQGVNGIYYYFFKGFINLGVFLLREMQVKKILSHITELFGEPVIVDEQTMVYTRYRLRVVFYRTKDEKCMLYYIPEYMCSNYVFEDKTADD